MATFNSRASRGRARNDMIVLNPNDYGISQETMDAIKSEVNKQLGIICHRHACRESYVRSTCNEEIRRLHEQISNLNAELARVQQTNDRANRDAQTYQHRHGTYQDIETMQRVQGLLSDAWTLLGQSIQHTIANAAPVETGARDSHMFQHEQGDPSIQADLNLDLQSEGGVTVD